MVELSGKAVLASDTRSLIRKVRPGDIVVIDQNDLDGRSAQAIARSRPAAVLNTQRFISGRFPATGAAVLAQANVPLVEACGSVLLSLKDGATIRLSDGAVYRGTDLLARGTELSGPEVQQMMRQAEAGLAAQVATFTANAMAELHNPRGVLLDSSSLPDVGAKGKKVLVISRAEDLANLRRFIKDQRPVVIAVDDAIDAMPRFVPGPEVIVGGISAVSDSALKKVHALVLVESSFTDADRLRLESLGKEYHVVAGSTSPEDLAILLAHRSGAELIVNHGTESSLIDYLEHGTTRSAGSFLTRLKTGATFVDSRALGAIYRSTVSWWLIGGIALLALAAAGFAFLSTDWGQDLLDSWRS